MAFPTEPDALLRDIDEYLEILRNIGSSDPQREERRGLALWRIAEDLFRLDRFEESADRFNHAAQILSSFESLGGYTVYARVREAGAYIMLRRDREALGILEALFRDVGITATVPEMPDVIVDALKLWLATLERLGEDAKADLAAGRVIDRYDPGATDAARLLVAQAFAMRARFALKAGDPKGALLMSGQAAARCSGTVGAAFVEVSCRAMLSRARAYELAQMHDEAYMAWGELADRFSAVPNEWARGPVTEATHAIRRLKLDHEAHRRSDRT